MLRYVLDEEEFLSPFGIRSLSRFHADHPFSTDIAGREFRVSYEPGESESGMFGGNSNWRGPVWFPINVLVIEALDRLHSYYGDRFLVEYPTGSGSEVPLKDVADDLARRLVSLFTDEGDGTRTYAGGSTDPGLILFHEYFNGDTGFGLGASHQTGWTGAVADLIRRLAD